MINQTGIYRIVEKSGRRRIVRVGRLQHIGWLIWFDESSHEAGRVKDLALLDVERLSDNPSPEIRFGE